MTSLQQLYNTLQNLVNKNLQTLQKTLHNFAKLYKTIQNFTKLYIHLQKHYKTIQAYTQLYKHNSTQPLQNFTNLDASLRTSTQIQYFYIYFTTLYPTLHNFTQVYTTLQKFTKLYNTF